MTERVLWRIASALTLTGAMLALSACASTEQTLPAQGAGTVSPEASAPVDQSADRSDIDAFFAARDRLQNYYDAHSSSSARSATSFFVDAEFREVLGSFIDTKTNVNRTELWLTTYADVTGPGLNVSAAQAVEQAQRAVATDAVEEITLHNDGPLLSWEVELRGEDQDTTVTINAETAVITEIDD